MTLVAAHAFINCRISSEIKAQVRAVADRRGVTESRLLKDLLGRMLREAGVYVPAPPPERINRNARLTLRLRPEDQVRLIKRAAERGMPSATYVSLLVRFHLGEAAPLPRAEYLALRESVAELGAIGRNLNQIARSVNQGQSYEAPGGQELETMLRATVRLREHFKALLLANARSWSSAPTSA
jgi:predicted DNA binding CopG/RHH family protein